MPIAPKRVRAAKKVIARYRKAQRKARPIPPRPIGVGQRRPRLKDPGYLAFIRRQPCCVCGRPGPSHAAHVRSGYPDVGWRPTGMGEKPDDWRTLPLCAVDHVSGPGAQHRSNERAWWAAMGIYPPALVTKFVGQFRDAVGSTASR